MDQPVNNHDVTLNDLAGMVKRGFDEMTAKFEVLERGQEDIKLRFINGG